jgi:hypothetical protein
VHGQGRAARRARKRQVPGRLHVAVGAELARALGVAARAVEEALGS